MRHAATVGNVGAPKEEPKFWSVLQRPPRPEREVSTATRPDPTGRAFRRRRYSVLRPRTRRSKFLVAVPKPARARSGASPTSVAPHAPPRHGWLPRRAF